MNNILPHQWLEIQPSGEQARQDRALPAQERELLNAVRSSPLRVVDLFRRLRMGDGRHFQELLTRAQRRGWLTVHETEPVAQAVADAGALADPEIAPPDETEALRALLAKHDAVALAPSELHPAGAPAIDPPSPAPLPARTRGSEPSRPAPEPEPELAPVVRRPVSPEEYEAVMRALGAPERHEAFDDGSTWSAPIPAPAVSGEQRELLEALEHAATAPGSGTIEVPAYGVGSDRPSPSVPPLDPGFVRLRDVGAVFGPGDGPSSPASQPSPAVPLAPEIPTEREQARQRARQQMLAQARRETAEREAAKERAAAHKERQRIAEEDRHQKVAAQRAQEDLGSRSTLRGRAETLKRIFGTGTEKKDLK